MPNQSRGESVSPINSQPVSAVMGGTRHMSSMDTREPISTRARKSNKSPMVNPTSPDTESQIHACPLAPVGSGWPRTSHR